MQPQAQEFQLLTRPTPNIDEGIQGYLFRLAEANYLTFRDLMHAGISYDYEVFKVNGLLPEYFLNPQLHDQIRFLNKLLQETRRIFNLKMPRYCPHCLNEGQYWRVEWELYFYDTCHIHECWLVDQCTQCHQPLTWDREQLLRCSCGATFGAEETQMAPKSMQLLATHLSLKIQHTFATSTSPHPVIDGLSIDQLQRLIRYFGNYQNPVRGRKPLKMRGAAVLNVSWPVTTVAAEILVNWPEAFSQTLDKLQKAHQSTAIPSLNKVFGQVYHYIYKGLRDYSYEPVRQAFEQWVAQSWKGTIAKRNKRLTTLLLTKAAWIPGNLACEKLGISAQRLQLLIDTDVVIGEVRYTPKGRKYTMVRRDNLAFVKANLDGLIDMSEAGALLGLQKRRMGLLLRYLFPQAKKSGYAKASPWCISRHDVNALLELGLEKQVQYIPDEDCITLAHILKYWALPPQEVVAIINGVVEDELHLVARLDSAIGITAWVLEIQGVNAFLMKFRHGKATWMTITQTAKAMGELEKVVYQMAKFGFLETAVMPNQAKQGTRVKASFLKIFQENYVFGTELGRYFNLSPKKVITKLASIGIEPISGPMVDGGRKVLYARSEAIKDLIREVKGDVI